MHIELEGGGGDLHISLPYSMIEPIRELLDSIQSDRGEVDNRWRRALDYEVMETKVDVYGILLEKTVTVEDVLNMEAGDIIPVDIPEDVVLYSEEVPLFHGRVGVANGNYAIKIEHKVDRGPDLKPATQMLEHMPVEEENHE